MSRSNTRLTACPHDCPSTCSLEVEQLDDGRAGRLRGAAANTYTAGVICAKVARYAERLYHPERLTTPLRRIGARGSADFAPMAWDDALDLVAERLLDAERRFGPATVWPYYYAGTMGLVQRDGINRLRHAKRYSGFYGTICSTIAWTGFRAGTGRVAGADPREMARSDLVVIWGTNAVATQVNVMTHAMRARKDRGATIVVVDVYRTATARQADVALIIRPGTDGALAAAVMHVLFRDGLVDRAYLDRYTADADGLEQHLADRTPAWAAAITGLSVAAIESFARLVGQTKRAYFRVGYGFTRSRNGAVNMHAVISIPTVTGAWQYEGGGAFLSNSGIYHWDKTLIEGLDVKDPTVRTLDQSRIGAVLTGADDALAGGPPVTALFIQNTNPVAVAPDQSVVQRGFARDDLFVCVHEQFMTETARMADIVLPATMFLEHDDLYQSGGNQHIHFGPKLFEPPAGCRSNHTVIQALAERLGAPAHPGFAMTERELIDATLRRSGWGSLDDLEPQGFRDVQPPFREAHYLDGFAWPDRRFHFRVDWLALARAETDCPSTAHMPCYPDHWAVTEAADADHPFRLVTAPAHHFLNTSFTETATSRRQEGRPTVKIHPDDLAALGVDEGAPVELGNERGTVQLVAESCAGLQRGVVVAVSIWPTGHHAGGRGINTLTSADPVAPAGGAAFHDSRVRIRPV